MIVSNRYGTLFYHDKLGNIKQLFTNKYIDDILMTKNGYIFYTDILERRIYKSIVKKSNKYINLLSFYRYNVYSNKTDHIGIYTKKSLCDRYKYNPTEPKDIKNYNIYQIYNNEKHGKIRCEITETYDTGRKKLLLDNVAISISDILIRFGYDIYILIDYYSSKSIQNNNLKYIIKGTEFILDVFETMYLKKYIKSLQKNNKYDISLKFLN
jgi:hypothetical protein